MNYFVRTASGAEHGPLSPFMGKEEHGLRHTTLAVVGASCERMSVGTGKVRHGAELGIRGCDGALERRR